MTSSELINGFLDLLGKTIRKKICNVIDAINQKGIADKLQKKGFVAFANIVKKIDFKLLSQAIDKVDESKFVEAFNKVTAEDMVEVVKDINQKNVAQVLDDLGFTKLANHVKSEAMTQFIDSFSDVTIQDAAEVILTRDVQVFQSVVEKIDHKKALVAGLTMIAPEGVTTESIINISSDLERDITSTIVQVGSKTQEIVGVVAGKVSDVVQDVPNAVEELKRKTDQLSESGDITITGLSSASMRLVDSIKRNLLKQQNHQHAEVHVSKVHKNNNLHTK